MSADEAVASETIVVQHRKSVLNRSWKGAWCGWASDARDGAEIFVDGPEVVIGQMAETGPRHGLEKVRAERKRNATAVDDSRRAGWVEVIQVRTGPHNLNKFGKGVASYGEAGFIGCQVAGDDMGGAGCDRPEIPPATKIGGGIDYGRLAKVWILVWKELTECRASAVALVAGNVGVDDIAAESDERPVFAIQIQRDGCNVQPPLNP